MRQTMAICGILLSASFVFGQPNDSGLRGVEVNIDNEWIRQDAGTPPMNSDERAFNEIILKNLTYPRKALRMGIEGNVICMLEISKDGETTSYSILKDIGADTDIEMKRVLQLLPKKWIPAIVNEKPVDSRIKLLFKFHLGKLSRIDVDDLYNKIYLTMATGGGKWKVVDESKIKIKFQPKP